MKPIAIPSSKGNLAAVIHEPSEPTGKLAILCPGFVDSKDYAGLIGLADALCERGDTVVRFDPTGTWASDGEIADYTPTQYLNDITYVIEFMLKRGSFTHILLGGHSRGGATAIEYASRDPRISAVLAIMASSGRWLTDHRRQQWQETGVRLDRRDLPADPATVRTFAVPYSFQLDRDQYDTVAAIQKLHVPILLVAGEHDTLVPPGDVQFVFDHANEPKRLIIVPGIGHDYRHHSEQVQLVNRMILEHLDLLE